MLSDRRQRVLAALIEEYVANALPVGSKTLTDRYHLGVSPATVRNELSVLEDGGYITQPHTSAGRIPTDYGYRAFVDNLLSSGTLIVDESYEPVIHQLRSQANELDELMMQTSAALTSMTDCLSVVLAPTVLRVRIKQISVISLSAFHALVVLVTEEGQVYNRHMDFGAPVDPDELARVQVFLSEALGGKSLSDIEQGLDRAFAEGFRDPLVRAVFEEVMNCLHESSGARPHRVGLSTLMRQPEFAQTQQLLPIMSVLEDDTVLLQLLADTAGAGDGTVVRIGAENADDALNGVSVVANKYGRGDSAGVVAVIGPTRMDYSKVIKAVRLASDVLQGI